MSEGEVILGAMTLEGVAAIASEDGVTLGG